MEEDRFIGKELKEKRLETIIYLRDVKELKFKQIAPQVGLKESAVQTKYRNAKRGLV